MNEAGFKPASVEHLVGPGSIDRSSAFAANVRHAVENYLEMPNGKSRMTGDVGSGRRIEEIRA